MTLYDDEKLFVRQVVARGAALLDSVVPDWRIKVDLDRLSFAADNNGHDILTQVFGNWGHAGAAIGVCNMEASETFGFSMPLGSREIPLTADERAEVLALLEQEWKSKTLMGLDKT